MKKGGRGGTDSLDRDAATTIHRLKVVLQGLGIFRARGKGWQERWIKFEERNNGVLLLWELSLIHRVFAWIDDPEETYPFLCRSFVHG